MDESENLRHSKWERKGHIVFIPKCRRKVLYGNLRQHMGEVFRGLADQKGSRIKCKSAIRLARTFVVRKQNCAGQNFWALGYLVSTVGRDGAVIPDYIRNQEKEDESLEQLNL